MDFIQENIKVHSFTKGISCIHKVKDCFYVCSNKSPTVIKYNQDGDKLRSLNCSSNVSKISATTKGLVTGTVEGDIELWEGDVSIIKILKSKTKKIYSFETFSGSLYCACRCEEIRQWDFEGNEKDCEFFYNIMENLKLTFPSK